MCANAVAGLRARARAARGVERAVPASMELAEAPAEPGAAELPSRLELAPAAAAAAEPEEEPEEEDDEPDAKRRAADIFLRGGPKKELAPGQARRVPSC